MLMKTVKQYLKGLQNPEVKSRALKNLDNEKAADNVHSLEHAIYWAFGWHLSPEGFNYWKAIHHNIKYPDNTMPVPEI